MAPTHLDEWLLEGLAFIAAGVLQLVLAGVFLTRPSSLAIRLSCLANAAFIAAWAVTRVSGMPFGPDAGLRETASFIDLTCVGLEAALIIVGYELLVRPTYGASVSTRALRPLAVVPIGILALATAAIAAPSSSDHAHHHEEAALAAGHHHHGAAGELATTDDKGLSLLMNGQGEGGGHTHNVKQVKLDKATQRELDAQLALTKPLIEKYPTIADAEAAGYRREGPFSPGLGTHYGGPRTGSLNADGKMDAEDIASPTLIYDGISPDSKLAGFMYISFGAKHAPEGFAGPNDGWHFHTNVCIAPRPDGGIDAPLGADAEVSKELCDKYHGSLIGNTGYMVHLWTVPGYESPQGLFSNVNAKITCADGTYHTIQLEELGTRSTVCRDGSA
jgi:hypothetical protein